MTNTNRLTWTNESKKELKDAWHKVAGHVSPLEFDKGMAKILGRSPNAVQLERSKLGLVVHHKDQPERVIKKRIPIVHSREYVISFKTDRPEDVLAMLTSKDINQVTIRKAG